MEGVLLMLEKKCLADGLPKAVALEVPTVFFLTAATKRRFKSNPLVVPTCQRAVGHYVWEVAPFSNFFNLLSRT